MSFKLAIFNSQAWIWLKRGITTGLVLNYLLIGAIPCWAIDKTNTKQSGNNQVNIKSPNVAGGFYPKDRVELNNILDFLLNSEEKPIIKHHVYGLISPHAGYIYSGQVAAKNYQAITPNQYKTIVILAPSHYFKLDCAAIYSQGSFQTPLGLVSIDQGFAQQLIKNETKLFTYNPSVFEKEHAIEVQLPFLQKTQDDFKIVPILIPALSYEFTQSLAQALSALTADRDDVLIIASTDLSHYHDLATANKIDQQTLEYILKLQPKQLFDFVSEGKSELCGSAAVATLLQVMINLKANNAQLLKYATSADSAYMPSLDKTSVVGYAAVIFTNPKKLAINSNQRSGLMLNSNQKKELISVARESIVNIVKSNRKQIVSSDDPELMQDKGAFVTIYKNNALRGCIGMIKSDQPLVKVVNDMAVQAATRDPRFAPVSEDELDNIELEISVISPIERITDINLIQVGKHGLIVSKGYNSGLLLPQVAAEYNWSKEEFLAETCVKAGLSKDDWKKGAEIFIFSAEVFSEKELQ
ncbi:MAG: AmmeMemoRadiSam system protein B [Candidatus Omnitrophica bacterium]|nr:AmmeMemoRadiSam system protein B [Candidatus Omnitrophota bacterium]